MPEQENTVGSDQNVEQSSPEVQPQTPPIPRLPVEELSIFEKGQKPKYERR